MYRIHYQQVVGAELGQSNASNLKQVTCNGLPPPPVGVAAYMVWAAR